MYTSLKLFLSILLCILFLVGCDQRTTYSTPPEFHEHPDAAKIEYPDINIYYAYHGVVYQYNIKTKTKKELVENWDAHLSHDKTKLIYTKGQKIYLYTIKTGENKLVYTKPIEVDPEPISFIEWSPDDKYFITSFGSTEIESKTLVEVATGKVVTEFEIFGHSYWINNQEILINDVQDNIAWRDHSSYIPAHGIAIINIETKQKKIIKQATPTEDYLCMVDDNNQIMVKKSIYKLETAEPQTKITDTYFIMNKEGNQIKQISYDPWESKNNNESNNYIILKNELKELLPLPYKNYKDIWVKSIPSSNWVVLMLNNNYEHNELFIMDKTNPHSLRKIGESTSQPVLFLV